MTNLIDENYDACIDLMALNHELAQDADIEKIKAELPEFRTRIVKNFGTDLKYSFMEAKKTISTNKEMRTPPNSTLVHIQFENTSEFGVLAINFDDTSGKILNIKTLEIKRSIPNMVYFWLFGIIAICIPAFNIYIIVLIKRSDRKKKWLKYLAVAFLNFPTIAFSALGNLQVNLSAQFLLGISFNYMGYVNSVWGFGIPLGGLFWLYRLKFTNPSIEKREESEEKDLLEEPISRTGANNA